MAARRRALALAVLAASLGAGGAALWRLTRGSPAPSDARPGTATPPGPRAGADDRPRAVTFSAKPLQAEPPWIAALARAYAAAGMAEDGVADAIASLDAAARARLPAARAMLARQPRRPGEGRPTRVEPGGVLLVDPPGPSRPADPARIAEARRHPQPLSQPPLARALRQTPHGPELLEGGLWADTGYTPALARIGGLRVADLAGAGYAVRVVGERAADARLDGGLVVPGRWYHVQGQAVFGGDAPYRVEIRPLAAVPWYHDRPAEPAPPTGAG